MQIFTALNNPTDKPLALTIGHFDGVHLGHQAILQTLVATADKKHLCPAVMTFSPHAKIFFHHYINYLISSDAEKTTLIEQYNIRQYYQIPFDERFSHISATDFIAHLLSKLNVRYLLVGDDFRFGYRGSGDFTLLQQHCATADILVEHTPTINYQNERVSSSRVRQAIKAADFTLVSTLLNRPLSYSGRVISDRKLGRQLGFPTANIRLPNERLLPNGVFAVTATLDGDSKTYNGMSNIGHKPTIAQQNLRQIETHLFDFDADLYGKILTLRIIAKLRDEQKFPHITALIAQLHRDKEQSLSLLKSSS